MFHQLFRLFNLKEREETPDSMTRGNQRDQARAKNEAKKASENKGQRADGKTLAKSKEDDAEIMRQKQAKAAAKKEAEGK